MVANKKIVFSLGLVLVLSLFLITFSSAFSGAGSGTLASPYQITNWSQLNEVRNDLSANYILVNNLSSSTAGYNGSGNNWAPIGNDTTQFTGNFNGNGNTISNLIINLPSTNYVGLFGYTTGDISNLGLVNVNISGNTFVGGIYTGGLTGEQDGGSISNSYSTGNIDNFGSGSASSSTGGLVGFQNSGSISNSYSTGNIMGSSGSFGGLVGKQFGGSISNSYSTGNVAGSGNSDGGLVGSQFEGSSISSSISNSYSTGNVTGFGGWTGGLVGFQGSGSINNSFWYNHSQGLDCYFEGNTRCTSKDVTYFKGNVATSAPFSSWNFNTTWCETTSYPALRWQGICVSGDTSSPSSFVGRSFSSSAVESGQNIEVTLNVEIGTSSFYAIDELIPSGWSIVNLGGADNSQSGHLKWLVISGATNTNYQYTLKAPSVSGKHNWTGTYQFEGQSSSANVAGANQVIVACAYGDSDCSGTVSLSELMNYIGLWKADSSDVTMIDLLKSILYWKRGYI